MDYPVYTWELIFFRFPVVIKYRNIIYNRCATRKLNLNFFLDWYRNSEREKKRAVKYKKRARWRSGKIKRAIFVFSVCIQKSTNINLGVSDRLAPTPALARDGDFFLTLGATRHSRTPISFFRFIIVIARVTSKEKYGKIGGWRSGRTGFSYGEKL